MHKYNKELSLGSTSGGVARMDPLLGKHIKILRLIRSIFLALASMLSKGKNKYRVRMMTLAVYAMTAPVVDYTPASWCACRHWLISISFSFFFLFTFSKHLKLMLRSRESIRTCILVYLYCLLHVFVIDLYLSRGLTDKHLKIKRKKSTVRSMNYFGFYFK